MSPMVQAPPEKALLEMRSSWHTFDQVGDAVSSKDEIWGRKATIETIPKTCRSDEPPSPVGNFQMRTRYVNVARPCLSSNGVTSLRAELLNSSRINCETQPISGDGFIAAQVNNIESQFVSRFNQFEARWIITHGYSFTWTNRWGSPSATPAIRWAHGP
jgi:hypothetical protein